MRFDGPYPLDFIFLKIAGQKHIVCEPLCELFATLNNVSYDTKQSNQETVYFVEPVVDGKSFKISRKDLINKLQHDVYLDQVKITDIVIQPEGEMQTPEVTQFLEHK